MPKIAQMSHLSLFWVKKNIQKYIFFQRKFNFFSKICENLWKFVNICQNLSKFVTRVLPFMDVYQHAKNQSEISIPSRDIIVERKLRVCMEKKLRSHRGSKISHFRLKFSKLTKMDIIFGFCTLKLVYMVLFNSLLPFSEFTHFGQR